MKKVFTFLAAVLLTASVFAQSPEKMSYQAVIRDVSSNLVTNQTVGMQISILQGSTSGTAVYVETQTPTSNANGLVSLEIGAGTVVSGSFSIIDWANGPYFLKTETDPIGGTAYTITGTNQLLSVPYALHAKTADTVTGGITETDPVFGTSIAGGITAIDTSNWNHKLDSYTETDPVFGASIASGITGGDTTYWNNKLDVEIDGSITNELNTSLMLNGTVLELTDSGGTLSADFSSLITGGSSSAYAIHYLRQRYTILVGNNYYSPAVLNVNKGDTVEFVWVEGVHTITTVATTGNDVWDEFINSTNTSFTTVIDGDTVVDYYCQAHGETGKIIINNPDAVINGNSIEISSMDNDPTNEIQTLSYSNDTLSISGGNAISFPLNSFSNIQSYSKDSTWICPNGTTTIFVKCWGAGGGGGGIGGINNFSGGGGGGGAYVESFITVTPNTAYSIILGKGGGGGTQVVNGSSGGVTSFDVYVQASGGNGGIQGNLGGAGGSGVSTGTNLLINGKAGQTGNVVNGPSTIGGVSYNSFDWGTGGVGGTHTINAGKGGNGQDGFIILYW